MNTIHNFISGSNLTDEQINDALPCDGATVYVWNVSKIKTGYGHWKVTTDVEVGGKRLNLSIITTDSVAIDQWTGSDDDWEDRSQEVIDGFAIQCLEENHRAICDALELEEDD